MNGDAELVRFGVFEADFRSGELRRNGRKIHLQEQPFQLLFILIRNGGAVVTRDELRHRLWPDRTYADFDHGIRTAINKVREALGDDAQHARYVETLPRHGYRFVAPVTSVREPVSRAAHEAYLKGTYALKRSAGGLVIGIQHFRESIAQDPTYAPASVGLALLHIQVALGYGPPIEALEQAARAAQRALAIDRTLVEAASCLAWIDAFVNREWTASDAEFRRALERDSGAADAHRLYSWCLSALGRHDEAIAHSKRARELDPASLLAGYGVAASYWWARRYDLAAAESDNLEQIDPTFPGAHRIRGGAYVTGNHYELAIAEFERESALAGGGFPPWSTAHLACAYARSGNRRRAGDLLDQLERGKEQRYVSPYLLSVVHTSLGQFDSAIEWLRIADDERNPMLGFIRVDPLFDPLRSDRRLTDLIERQHLPA